MSPLLFSMILLGIYAVSAVLCVVMFSYEIAHLRRVSAADLISRLLASFCPIVNTIMIGLVAFDSAKQIKLWERK